jgi:titin
VLGNYIGTDPTGSLDKGNSSNGVMMIGGHDNTIGGSAAGAGNVISGNSQLGIFLSGSGVHHNAIEGNYIGTNAAGDAALPNQYGIYIIAGAHDNAIGGDTPAEGNLISGNQYDGVQILGSNTVSNTVSANYIGTDATGMGPLANGRHGIAIASGARYNAVGGDAAGEGNLISGNGETGVYLDSMTTTNTMSNTISGNLIGTNISGTLPISNTGHGVGIYGGAQYNVVGGDTETERNVIAGNGWSGVALFGGGARHNLVLGNYIGTNAAGSAELGNGFSGVHLLNGAQYNRIGGNTATERNIISGNVHGVRLEGARTMSNTVSGNYIGTDAAGSSDLGNVEDGVWILGGAQWNTIGGEAAGEGNLVSANDDHGIQISGSGTMSNTVAGNLVGLGAGGLMALANGGDGVHIRDGAQSNDVGPGNQVALNSGDGVEVRGSATLSNTVTENSIHGNGLLGIENWLGGNTELSPPVIFTPATTSFLEGTAPPNSRVELFTGPDEEGKTFLTFTMADGVGNWSVSLAFISEGFVTATTTDGAGNTSEFSELVEVEAYYVFLPLVMRNH